MEIFDPNSQALFELWTPSHIIAMVLFAATWVIVPVWINRVKKKGENFIKTDRVFRRSLAAVLGGQYLIWIVWEIAVGRFSLEHSLPFNLCDFSVIMVVILLLTRNFALYEVIYFWALAGTIQSYITPNLHFGWPHLEFIVFYIQHGGLILSIVYLTAAGGIRPRPVSMLKTLVWVLVFVAFVYVFNYLSGANYMFLMADTPHPSTVTKMIKMFGPPPRHLLGLGLVTLVSVLILYSPFALKDLVAKLKKK